MSASEKVTLRLLGNAGLISKLNAELAVERAEKHAAARARKAAAITKYLRDKRPVEDDIKALDRKAAEAQRAAEASLNDYVSARSRLDGVYDTMRAVVEPCDRELLSNYDPRIDDFAAELQVLRDATPALARTWLDPNGKFKLPNGERGSTNQAAIDARIRALNEALDACNRLKIDERVDDVPAELARLRNFVPSA